jgi:hypothetical protein
MVRAGTGTGSFIVSFADSTGTITQDLTILVSNVVEVPLAASTTSVSLNVGGTQDVTITGGSPPYSILTDPDTAIATAALSDSTVTLTGVATGDTSVVVSDSAAATVSISISVGAPVPATPAGEDPGSTSVSVAADQNVALSINISNAEGLDPETEIMQEWWLLVTVTGADNQLAIFFVTDQGTNPIVDYFTVTDFSTVTWDFDHSGGDVIALGETTMSALGLSAEDLFLQAYLYSTSADAITDMVAALTDGTVVAPNVLTVNIIASP